MGISYWPVGGNQTKQRVFRRLGERVEVTFLDPSADHPDLVAHEFDLYHLAKRRTESIRDLHRAARAGVPTLNPPAAVAQSSDRVATLDALRRGGIPVPDYQYNAATDVTFDPPYIIKTRHETDDGAHDHDVVLTGRPAFDGVKLVQEYVLATRHLKVYRVGATVRVVELGLVRGAVRGELEPTPALVALTEHVAALTGLSLFEVDVLDGHEPLVVDVNPVVSLAGVADAESVYLDYLLASLAKTEHAQNPMRATASLD
ncbi:MULTISPECIES: RimK family alpha-L-glutamate ligase [unclassified Haladaptatus]|uniref:ATP-grasp domain-containing protein n=1 Tax=unclassified Haladaptatus TaxID=2622732 RepID=UPI0023E7F387|nr:MULTISPECIES: hypothetical protein [unclassified Haladaptatus]